MAVLKAFKGTEIEHGFNVVQIILVLELADAKHIYTYPLPEEESISDENYIQAAQDLMARGFIENAQEEGGSRYGLRLTPKAMNLFESMIDPVRVTEVISAWTGTIPALIYQGRGAACTVSRWDSAGGYIGISLLDPERIGEWLDEEGFLPGQPFETIREAQKAMRYDPKMQEIQRQVMDGLVCHPQEPPSLWAVQKNVRCAIKSYDISPKKTGAADASYVMPPDQKAVREAEEKTTSEITEETEQLFTGEGPGCLYVFLDTDTESWILTDTGESGAGSAQDSQRWSIEPDSAEYRKKIWRKIL